MENKSNGFKNFFVSPLSNVVLILILYFVLMVISGIVSTVSQNINSFISENIMILMILFLLLSVLGSIIASKLWGAYQNQADFSFRIKKQICINQQNHRKSNIEMLRIVAMIMIIAHHIAVHSSFNFAFDSISFNRLWIQFIQMGGKIGVNIYVLISGYFLITANSVKTNKIIKLWLQIFTYSVGIFLVIVLVSPQSFEIKALIKNILPITFSKWWFASTYFMLYLISPYINKLLNSFNKKTYQRFLVLLFFCWCLIPTFLSNYWQSNELLWFVFLYALAGYVRLYIDIASFKSSRCILIALAVMLLTFFSAIVFDILGLKIGFFAYNTTFFYDMQKLPILIISLMLFIGFANANIGYNHIINTVSSACFGIYLFHDNNYIRNLLWRTIFQNASHQKSDFLILYTLMQIVVVFVISAILELLRIHLIEKIYLKPIDNLSNWANKKLKKLFSHRIFNKF